VEVSSNKLSATYLLWILITMGNLMHIGVESYRIYIEKTN